MDLPVEIKGDVAVVTVCVDELDAGNAVEFKRAMAPVLETNANVVLDLGKLHFIDSSGLGAFLSCLRKVNAKHGDLKLCRVSKQVWTVIELVRMHRMLDILATPEDAVHSFKARAGSGARTGIPQPAAAASLS